MFMPSDAFPLPPHREPSRKTFDIALLARAMEAQFHLFADARYSPFGNPAEDMLVLSARRPAAPLSERLWLVGQSPYPTWRGRPSSMTLAVLAGDKLHCHRGTTRDFNAQQAAEALHGWLGRKAPVTLMAGDIFPGDAALNWQPLPVPADLRPLQFHAVTGGGLAQLLS